MLKEDLKYLIALSAFAKFNSKSLLKIKRAFINLKDAWKAEAQDFIKIGLNQDVIVSFLEERKKIDPDREWQRLIEEKIEVISFDDAFFPPLLREIYDPPALLYYRGNLKKDELSLAVVGSRRLGPYGRQVIEKLIPGLVQNDFTIVSGLALGADAAAHQECLRYGGRTIAVLGSGIDKASVYPKYNARLAEKIIDDGGLIMSEFPVGTLPFKSNFPIRNRIISGLSRGTLIIEATEDSGSLITAKLALEQNRDVFVVPGSIFSPLSSGPNQLLKLGAKAVTSFEDILEEFDVKQISLPFKNELPSPASQQEAEILKILTQEPKHIDRIASECGRPAFVVSGILSIMEMSGKIKNTGGMNYVKKA